MSYDPYAHEVAETEDEQQVLDGALDHLAGGRWWRDLDDADNIRRGTYPDLKKIANAIRRQRKDAE